MVRLRLTRMGRKKRPYYRIIAVDGRKKRDGAFLERLGYYHPLDNPASIKIDAEKTLKWLRVGAQPSETVRSLLRKEGIWYRFRLEKRGLPESQIQTMMVEWFEKNKNKVVEEKQATTEKESTPVEITEESVSENPEVSATTETEIPETKEEIPKKTETSEGSEKPEKTTEES